MRKDLHVKITYRNQKREPVSTQLYSLEDYTNMQRNDLIRIISDIEGGYYAACGNKGRDEWPDDVWSSFIHIKHKILDKAGDIQRLPENIVEEGVC